MTQTTRRHALALMGAGVLASCTEAPIVTDPSGSSPVEGGIGGTGIVGVLVGFGSLLVNGLRIEVNDQTRLRTAFGRVGQDALRVGLPLTIYATRWRGNLVARNISLDYVLIGDVRSEARGLTVNGVSVVPEPGAHGALIAGTRVAVGGIWTRAGVSASLIVPAPDVPDLISGTVAPSVEASFAIGPTPVSHRGVRPQTGGFAAVQGRYADGEFLAAEVTTDRFRKAPDLRNLSVEGYLEPISQNPGFRVAGLGHSFARDVKLDRIGGQRTLFVGAYDGTFQADRGFILSDSFARRAALLKSTALDGGNLPNISL